MEHASLRRPAEILYYCRRFESVALPTIPLHLRAVIDKQIFRTEILHHLWDQPPNIVRVGITPECAQDSSGFFIDMDAILLINQEHSDIVAMFSYREEIAILIRML